MIKKLFGAVYFIRILVNSKVEKNNKYWILGPKNLSKPIQLYTNRFGFPMRFFFRKSIEKMFCSSKYIREKLKFFFKGFACREFLEYDVQTVFKQKLLIVANFSESFIRIGAHAKRARAYAHLPVFAVWRCRSEKFFFIRVKNQYFFYIFFLYAIFLTVIYGVGKMYF